MFLTPVSYLLPLVSPLTDRTHKCNILESKRESVDLEGIWSLLPPHKGQEVSGWMLFLAGWLALRVTWVSRCQRSLILSDMSTLKVFKLGASISQICPWDRYIYIYIYIYPYCTISTDIHDPLSPPLPIVHCFRQILRGTSRIGRDLLYIVSSWSSCLCSSIWRCPQECTTLMSSSLLLQECPAWLVRLILIVWWAYLL